MDLCVKHSCKNLAVTLESCKVKKEDRVGVGPQKIVVHLSLIEQYAAAWQGRAVEYKLMFIFCYVRSTNRTKTLLPVYFLSNRIEFTCIYMETMATTSESADKSTPFEV